MSEPIPKNNTSTKPLLTSFIENIESSRDKIFINVTENCILPFQKQKFDFPSSQQFELDQIPCSNNLDVRTSPLNKNVEESSGIIRGRQHIDENIMDYFASQYQEKTDIHNAHGKFLILNEKVPMLSQLNNNSYVRRNHKMANRMESRYSSGNVSYSFFENSAIFNPREEKNMPTKDKVENWLERSVFVSRENDTSQTEISMDWEENEFDYPNTEFYGKNNFAYVDYQDVIHLQSRKIDSLVRKAYFNEIRRYHEDTFDVSTLSSQ